MRVANVLTMESFDTDAKSEECGTGVTLTSEWQENCVVDTYYFALPLSIDGWGRPALHAGNDAACPRTARTGNARAQYVPYPRSSRSRALIRSFGRLGAR
jgi:hypothetical protein